MTSRRTPLLLPREIEEAGRSIDDNHAGLDVDPRHDGLDEGHLRLDPIREPNHQAILRRADIESDDLAEGRARGIEHAQTDQLIFIPALVVGLDEIGHFGEKLCPAQGFGTGAVGNLGEPEQPNTLVQARAAQRQLLRDTAAGHGLGREDSTLDIAPLGVIRVRLHGDLTVQAVGFADPGHEHTHASILPPPDAAGDLHRTHTLPRPVAHTRPSNLDDMARVLVVEDEPLINSTVGDRLRAEGYDVISAFTGPEAVSLAAEHLPDLIVLDIMLPGFDGIEVCRRVQATRPVPVLMLTARDDEADIIVGLGVGADDYLTKPFRMRELVARVKALLRRVERARELAERPGSSTTVGALVIDPGSRRVTLSGNEIHLTPLEFDLLAMLAASPGIVLTRERLLEQVWGWADASGTRTVDSHIKALRAKIGADRIRTSHGVGYALEVLP